MANYTLKRDLWYFGKRDTFMVPAGFVTDLATIPWPLSILLPPDGPWARPAILHDFQYRTQPWVDYTLGLKGVDRARTRAARKENDYYLESRLTRADADGIFRRFQKEIGVSWIKRNIIYYGVRLGGWLAWSRYAAALQDPS